MTKAFVEAAQKGDLTTVEKLIENGVPVNYSISMGSHMLSRTADGQEVQIAFFIEETTALHEASSHGHTKVVEYLLSKGADVDQKTVKGWTALHAATANGHLEVVKLLVAAGADVEAQDYLGFTPMYCPEKRLQRNDIVEALMAKPASKPTAFPTHASTTREHGKTAAHPSSQPATDGFEPGLTDFSIHMF